MVVIKKKIRARKNVGRIPSNDPECFPNKVTAAAAAMAARTRKSMLLDTAEYSSLSIWGSQNWFFYLSLPVGISKHPRLKYADSCWAGHGIVRNSGKIIVDKVIPYSLCFFGDKKVALFHAGRANHECFKHLAAQASCAK